MSAEHWAIRLLRVAFVVISFVALLLFAIYEIILVPYPTDNETYNTRSIQSTKRITVGNASVPLSIIAYTSIPFAANITNSPAWPASAVNAINASITAYNWSTALSQPCRFSLVPTDFIDIPINPVVENPGENDGNIQGINLVLASSCSNPLWPLAQDYSFDSTSISAINLLVTVNFTSLWPPSTNPLSTISPGFVLPTTVLVGWGDISDIISNTPPTSLVAGSQVVGGMRVAQRQVLQQSPLGILGIRSAYRAFPVAEIVGLRPDPVPPSPQANDIGTLRLYFETDLSNQHLIQDYTDQSVLSGLAALGGLWTIANGALVMLFGGSLVFFAFGGKPFSAFGVIHMFQKKRLREALRADFPAILTEGAQLGSKEAGLVAFIRNRLIGIEAVIENKGSQHSPQQSLLPLWGRNDDAMFMNDFTSESLYSTEVALPDLAREAR